jgi:integrase
MSAKHDLIYSIRVLLKHNKCGSYQTQHKRLTELTSMAQELTHGGFKLHDIRGLKQKHILFLNQEWQDRQLAAGTLKNKNAQLRFLCELLRKPNMMPSNDALSIAKRIYIPTHNKAIQLSSIDLSRFHHTHMQVYLQLQYHLGLRREEAIKIRPVLADKGDYLELQGSWCKGGRTRTIPILTPEARAVIELAKTLLIDPHHSLIPDKLNYAQQLHFYEQQVRMAGIKHPHGLRHAYAQRRYRELTGWECPINGGLTKPNMTAAQRKADLVARLEIAKELGHGRASITAQYIG